MKQKVLTIQKNPNGLTARQLFRLAEEGVLPNGVEHDEREHATLPKVKNFPQAETWDWPANAVAGVVSLEILNAEGVVQVSYPGTYPLDAVRGDHAGLWLRANSQYNPPLMAWEGTGSTGSTIYRIPG